ncbi:FimV/HubP family polar landmark protein [Herbaspirillum autotrophicum]|uniref:FimV/HubP family polar landmark protein n=1 Tax=Herbaspirillum autotrophicum TaxID=180195 RepID=UPI001E3FFCF8|nr:FimV/HubP family polar landmark protein [Herbaspirillum autotrophicum]
MSAAMLLLAASLPMTADAAGLGKLTVLSSLGQPLRAEIELTAVSKKEAAELVAKLASADAFSRANIDFNPVLSSLRFAVEQRQGKQLVKITSSQPINEPFVDLLLEVSGGGSRVVREYTFLLDPPDSRAPQSVQTAPAVAPAPAQAAPAQPAAAGTPSQAAPALVSNQEDEPVSRIVTKSAPSPLAEELIRNNRAAPAAAAAPTPAPASAPAPAAAAEETKPASNTRKGDVAAKTPAKTEAPAEKTGKANSYQVKTGDTLAEIAGKNKPRGVSLDQMLIALYQANPDAFVGENINRLRAGRVLTIPQADTVGAVDQGEARSQVIAQARDFNEYRNKLAGQVATGQARKATDTKQSVSGKITAKVEERNSAAGEARDKLQLSRSGDKDKASAAAAAEDKIAADKALAEANDRVKALEKNVGDLQKLLEIKDKTLADLSAQKAPEKPEAAAVAPVAATEAKPEENKPAAADGATPPAEPPAAVPAPPAVAPAAPATPVVAAPAAPKAEASALDQALANPWTLPGAGVVVAALAGLGLLLARRKKKPLAETEAEEEAAEETPEPVVAAPDAVVETEVDPITEADMYIAYGRDEQAEDVLRQALVTQPERHALRLKLLEIYAKREDVVGFNGAATELHAATGGVGEEWDHAVVMGALLDPGNPLYGGNDADDEEDVMQAIDVEGLSKAAAEEAKPEPAPKPVVTPPPPPPVAEDSGIEFDLSDFKGAEIQPGSVPPADLGNKIDFDLELDGEAPKGDLGALTAASAAALPDAPAKPAPAPVAMNDIDLDLPAAEPAVSATSAFDDEESAFAAEMGTKLDLAAAYQEIGDKEGARELLEEVIRGGTDQQVERAKAALSKLS